MKRRIILRPTLLLVGLVIGTTSCWDVIDHTYDCDITGQSTDTTGGVDTGTGSDVSPPGDDAGTTSGMGVAPAGWEGMGAPCETHEDCTHIETGGRCITNILGIINAPGGYCVACCDEVGPNKCAPGVDCVGLDNAFTVCVNHCFADDQCRQDEGYECRPIWHMEESFAGEFCMPDEAHHDPPPGSQPADPECDWPWIEE